MSNRVESLAGSMSIRQFTRFAIVGCLNVIVSFLVFFLCYRQWSLGDFFLNSAKMLGIGIESILTEFGIRSIDAALANTAGYVAGMVNSFTLNKLWTFRVQGDISRQMHRFVILNILGLILSTSFLFIFVDLLSAPYLIVWGISTAIVMLLNFFGNKYWTFAENHRQLDRVPMGNARGRM
jgi:putative flippase GtrA